MHDTFNHCKYHPFDHPLLDVTHYLQYCICSSQFSGLVRPIRAHEIYLYQDFHSSRWGLLYLLYQSNLPPLSTMVSYQYKCITPHSLRLHSSMALCSMIFSYIFETSCSLRLWDEFWYLFWAFHGCWSFCSNRMAFYVHSHVCLAYGFLRLAGFTTPRLPTSPDQCSISQCMSPCCWESGPPPDCCCLVCAHTGWHILNRDLCGRPPCQDFAQQAQGIEPCCKTTNRLVTIPCTWSAVFSHIQKGFL